MLKGLKYLVFSASFFAGVYFADDVKGLRANFYYQPQEGFYSRPYDLRIERKNIAGKLEVYLTDARTGDSHKVGPKMFVGSPTHRVRSVVNIPKEYLTKNNMKELSWLLGFCESILD